MLNDTPPITPRVGKINLFSILFAFVSVGFLLFAGLSINAYSKANTATTTLETQKAAAAKAAAAAQEKEDKLEALRANESPYRSYKASIDYGSFVINFPKNWSGYDVENVSNTDQVLLSLNPDFVHVTDGAADPTAVKVTLHVDTIDGTLQTLSSYLKKGTLSEQDITVSGIKATDVTGSFKDGKTIRAVYIPVRDKTLIISTEDAQYASEFNTVLAQAKINP